METPPLPTTPALKVGHQRLKEKNLLVIGGGQRVFDPATDPIGNGRAMCEVFASQGANVVVADQNLESAQVTVERIRALGGSASAIQTDVSRPDFAEQMLSNAEMAFGPLHGLVYNVGIGIEALDLEGVEPEDWDRTFSVNVRGAALALKAASDRLSSDGAVVLISSTAGLKSGGRLVAYQTSKSALFGLMRHAANELSTRRIRVNTICPGMVDTPNGRATNEANPNRAARSAQIPLGRMATAWDIAYAATFLVSDESSFITSQILAIDGGTTGI